MALFRRGASTRTAEDVVGDDTPTEVGQDADEVAAELSTPTDDVVDAAATDDGDAVADAGADLTLTDPRRVGGGPWDVDSAPEGGPRVDLGAIRLPGVPGMELRMEIDKATGAVTAAAVTLDGSTLQVQAFAAPRTEGIWDEIRAEIAESVGKQGGSADDLPGPFGRELLARLPVRTPEGRTGHRPARFIGADGPRWFLRGVLTGRAAVDPQAAVALEDIFAGAVVVRGTQARAPRDLLALTLPGQAGQVVPPIGAPAAPAVQPSFDPLTRGPEITEIR
ncbi:DUF3710 domain-containing protein [Cellulomonas hominis]